jgi:hypothetical protein
MRISALWAFFLGGSLSGRRAKQESSDFPIPGLSWETLRTKAETHQCPRPKNSSNF